MIHEPSILRRPAPVTKNEQTLMTGVWQISDGLEKLREQLTEQFSGMTDRFSGMSEQLESLRPKESVEVEEETPETPQDEPDDRSGAIREVLESLGTVPVPDRLQVHKGGELLDIELTAQQRATFARVSGETLHRILAGVVGSEKWDWIPAQTQKNVYDRAFAAAHELGAKAALPPEQRTGKLVRTQ
jgi:hypothetical protein